MPDYSPLRGTDFQHISAQVLRDVMSQTLSLSTTSAWLNIPYGAIGAMLYCPSSDFYWKLDAAALAAESLGSELLTNEGFETAGAGDPDFWTGWTENAGSGTLANETGTVQAGSDAASVTAGASLDTYVKQAITVSPGDLVKIVIYSYGTGTNDGQYQIRDATNGVDLVAREGTGQTAAAWAAKTVYVLAPNGCTSIELYLHDTAVNTEECFFDSCSMKVVTLASAFQTAATWFNVALHPDVRKVHGILSAGTATLTVVWLFG